MSSPGATLIFVRAPGADTAPLPDDMFDGMSVLVAALFLLCGAYLGFHAPAALLYRHWRGRAGRAELRAAHAACANAV